MGLINYTGRDFSARFEALLSEFRRLCPDLTDMNHSNAGVALIRLLGSESDFLSFYIDHAFSENFVDHAQFRQNLIRIGKNLDILPKLCSASRTLVTITRLEGIEGDIVIPKFTRFSRIDGVGYLTDDEVVLPAGTDSVTVGITQGELVENTVNIDEFRVEDHSQRLKYNIGTDVAAYTCYVTSEPTGEVWTEVESFYRTFDEDRHYCLELHADPIDGVSDTVFLTLNRKSGSTNLPQTLKTRFIKTAKERGNTGAQTITVCPHELEYNVSVTNETSSTGGGGPETAEQLRYRIPAVARTQRRAVTLKDYEALILSISGVRYVEAYDRSEDSQWPHRHVVLYVTPEGGGLMSQALRERILMECADKGHLGSWPKRYILKDMKQISVNINATVGIAEPRMTDSVFTQIRFALNEKYNLYATKSIKIIRFSDLHSLISGVQGVSWVEFNAPTGNQVARSGEILVMGSVTLTRGS